MSNTIFLWMKTGDEMANAYSTLSDRAIRVDKFWETMAVVVCLIDT
ncbi:hypothetical protein NDI44_03490 [Trichocoleus sp. DQ-A3]|nr:hypothetical protein [Coleofasciculus sp. FACHB-125]MBD1900779.1 hypothetical protein [Coleofasciculus sp. FACHB-125]